MPTRPCLLLRGRFVIGAFTQSNVWAAIGPDYGLIEIYENQRAPAVISSISIGMSLSGRWSSDHLLPTDPKSWTDGEGRGAERVGRLADVVPPGGYRWAGGWGLDLDGSMDSIDEATAGETPSVTQGSWLYGFDFSYIYADVLSCRATVRPDSCFARRRRWTRPIQKLRLCPVGVDPGWATPPERGEAGGGGGEGGAGTGTGGGGGRGLWG